MRNPREIEKLYSKADVALVSSGIVIVQNNLPQPVIGEYEGYIAGLGATVINMGIKPAIAAYCGNPPKDRKKPSRKRVIDAIAKTLMIEGAENADALLKKVIDNENSLTKSEMKTLREDIVNASVALKILIRTYPINKDVDI